jgi:hypothetical protein
MVDWIAIGEFVNVLPGLRVRDIWKYASTRPDVAGLLSKAKWVDQESYVEEWKYVRPILTFAQGNMQAWQPTSEFFEL